MAEPLNLVIVQGKTFSLVTRWETDPMVYKPITGISLAAGAPRLSVPAHGMPNGWRGAATRVQGMKQINARHSPPRGDDYHTGLVVDADTIELNAVAPYDAAGNEWPAYTAGGFWQYRTPVDLNGFTGRMKIKDRVGGTILASSEGGDGPAVNIINIAVDNVAKTITITMDADDTAAIDWTKGVYDLEMVSGATPAVVTAILTGKVSVTPEVTT